MNLIAPNGRRSSGRFDLTPPSSSQRQALEGALPRAERRAPRGQPLPDKLGRDEASKPV